MSNHRKGVKGFISLDAESRFWSRVDTTEGHGPNGDCWLWTGSTDTRYGIFHLNRRSVKAHRYSWELANGRPFPYGLQGCHSCDNPPCVNPNHIFPGTMRDNILDAVRKGRVSTPTQRGDRGWQAHLTHCKRGHEFNAENTVVKRGKRACRICQRMHQQKHAAKARAALAPATPAEQEKRDAD
jgi:hypothetical protein